MLQIWNIRSRAHHCALTNRPFAEGEKHYTAIYFDTTSGEYTRRDIAVEAWAQELSERTPFSHWKAVYEKNVTEAKPEITPKESALSLLQRLIEDDNPHTENARYILAAMLERKRILSPTATKENDQGHKLLFYEHKKTGDVFVIRDPELRLDELASVQEEVATLLGFGGPAAEAAKVAGVTIGPDGKVQPKEEKKEPAPEPEAAPPTEPDALPESDPSDQTDPSEDHEENVTDEGNDLETDSEEEDSDEEDEEEDDDDLEESEEEEEDPPTDQDNTSAEEEDLEDEENDFEDEEEEDEDLEEVEEDEGEDVMLIEDDEDDEENAR